MSNKRPKLDHQRTEVNNNNREETSSEVHFEYTVNDQHAPNGVTSVRFHPGVVKVERYSCVGRLQLKEVVLNEGLTVIGESAFQNCPSLQSIKLPSTLTEIGTSAFYVCPSLKDIVLNEGLREIGRYAFRGAPLESIIIPSTIDETGYYAFGECQNLRDVVLKEGLKKISRNTFRECPSLQSITLPSTVNEIDQSAFIGCTNLREVVLSDGLKKIAGHSFQSCTSLQRIELPSTVIVIEQFAFRDCSNLLDVVIHNEEIQIGDESFRGCTSLERFKFPRLSTRLDNIVQAGQRGIVSKIDDIPAVEWRGGELAIPVVRREIENRLWGIWELTEVDKEKLAKVEALVAYYEMKEAITLFELALWKARIDQADSTYHSDRMAYRTEVPGPVKDTIMQYL